MLILMNANVRSWWRVTDRHITLSERETNGFLPHLSAAAEAASTIISSFIMSNKATHRQTAFLFFQTSLTNSSFYNSDEMLKKQTEASSFSFWFCLGERKTKNRSRQQRRIKTKKKKKKKREYSVLFTLWLWSLGETVHWGGSGEKRSHTSAFFIWGLQSFGRRWEQTRIGVSLKPNCLIG